MDVEEPPEPPVVVKKKRGRKPKIKTDPPQPVEKKKRGRKKKIVDDPPPPPNGERKRKRGRKPKCEITSIHEIREKFNNVDDKLKFQNSEEHVVETDCEQIQVPFGNLNITMTVKPEIDKTELRNMFTDTEISQKSLIPESKENQTKLIQDSTTTDISESESDIPYNNTYICSKCKINKENEKLQTVKKEKKKIHQLLFKFKSKMNDTKTWPIKTSVLCWWCCHTFDSIPIPCVIKYDYIRNRYQIQGIFCSWNCSAAYSAKNCKSLFNLIKLKYEWTGKRGNIERAPPRAILKSFGGDMSIEEFRKNPFIDRKFISASGKYDFVENMVLESHKEIVSKKKKKYKLKRNKPLVLTN